MSLGRTLPSVARRTLLDDAERFRRETRRARSVARATLDEILAQTGDTAWGRRHGLDGANPQGAFQRHPLTTWPDAAPFLARMAAGEADVLTRDPVVYFSHSGGTTGAPKLLPITVSQDRALRRHMFLPLGLALAAGKLGDAPLHWLNLVAPATAPATSGGYPVRGITAVSFRQASDGSGTSPELVAGLSDPAVARYLHLLFALGEPRLGAILSVYPMALVYLLQELRRSAPALLADLFDGVVRVPGLPPPVRNALAARLEPSPGRARALERLFTADRFAASDVWPALRLVFSIGSGAFSTYLDQLRPLLGDVEIRSPAYLATEAPVGVGLPDREGYVLSPTGAWIELLPAEVEGPDASLPIEVLPIEVLPVEAAEIGATYEVVVTTRSGLTRYRLGDLVQVVGHLGEAPVVEFLGRRAPELRVFREKVTEMQVERAFSAAFRRVGIPPADHLVAVDPSAAPARYLLLVEGPEMPALAEAVDRELRGLNADYESYRAAALLDLPAVRWLRAGAFERLLARRVREGAGQAKVPRIAPDPGFVLRHLADELR